MIMREYIHKLPGDEGCDLPWAYLMIEEGRITHGEKEYIYTVGEVIAGCVCIGTGSVRFIHVPGYIISMHKRMDNNLRAVSIVKTVNTGEDQVQIKKILSEKYPAFQVCFL